MEAAAAMHDDRLDIAERILKPHLKEDPFDVRAIRKVAESARVARFEEERLDVGAARARVGEAERGRDPGDAAADDRDAPHAAVSRATSASAAMKRG